MNLLQIYKKKNEDKGWFLDHSTLAKGMAGKMFEYTNTNFRTQSSFTNAFLEFLKIENKPRELWPKQKDHKQEVHKQYVMNMIQSKLFKKNKNDLYSRTAKGHLYGDFVKIKDFTENDQWFANYLFLLNGYYLNRKNYIIHRVKEDLLGYLLSVEGITERSLIEDAGALLDADSLDTTLKNKFFYIHSFYNDPDFLTSYLRSTEMERLELASYIAKNLRNKDFQCCISTKYQPSGNFNRSMLIDETRVFLMTLSFIQSKSASLDNTYNIFATAFIENIGDLSEKQMLAYLYANKDIFEPIFVEILESEDVEVSVSEDAFAEIIKIEEIDKTDRPEEYIDETSEGGRLKIKSIHNIRKKQARMLSGYTCALEKINNCKPIYFTAKKKGKNYLELHHLIPREFRNDFSYSIEVLANYITLCPRCHRQIHLAIDRERKHLINSLYAERKDRLTVVKLELDLNTLYDYYRIES
ncbi:hypothetical protein A2755_03975 [Candidatus Wolfebacteria bacterium RIFCSPHIGHO2_01_FULL_48_22]|uniref:HNH domain-containing protein n=2 Tax=Candidatus Wolfeibacteriota TaxID=1752735 RepID=A0A1F8DNX7_9BACT|nr:MAG: hypothetical protein A2755_03975 [Candidatus Wolfebacteria bacterium RIFCSPHIGHO2_01_FULL_48_22]OGM93496.1 MAG: hypothetical protein A2935_01325 [Candidatus Wolfebacteria bacterium RIFCSPLOWO2_01_FULL_47_17b]